MSVDKLLYLENLSLFRGLSPQQMGTVSRRLEDLAFKDSRSRIADFLFDYARDYDKPRGDELVTRNTLTHQDIAKLTAR